MMYTSFILPSFLPWKSLNRSQLKRVVGESGCGFILGGGAVKKKGCGYKRNGFHIVKISL